jgi:hypothetical protein
MRPVHLLCGSLPAECAVFQFSVRTRSRRYPEVPDSRSLAKRSNLSGDRTRTSWACAIRVRTLAAVFSETCGRLRLLVSGQAETDNGLDFRTEPQRRIDNTRGLPKGSIRANPLPVKDPTRTSLLPVRIGLEDITMRDGRDAGFAGPVCRC